MSREQPLFKPAPGPLGQISPDVAALSAAFSLADVPPPARPLESFMDFDILHPEELLIQAAVDLGSDPATLHKLHSQWAYTKGCPPARTCLMLREQLEEEFADFLEFAQEAWKGVAALSVHLKGHLFG
jgi:hypothetical protein